MLFPDIVQDMVFWLLSVAVIGAALGVVLVRDLFRAVLLLAGVFVAVAGFFVLLSAEFLAVIQVLIYVGAISILFIFAIMLTQNVRQGNLPNRLQIPAVLFSTLLLAALVVVVTSTEWNLIPNEEQTRVDLVQTQSVNVLSTEALEQARVDSSEGQAQAKKAGLADLLIGPFILPFEAVSVLLLAALIGGLALARPPGGA